MNSELVIQQHNYLLGTDLLNSPIIDRSNTQPSNPSYMPFGFRAWASERSIRFTGNVVEHKATLYLLGNGHRPFSPLLMRFITPDALSPFDAGGLNTYAYCKAEPINSTDDSGKNPFFRIFGHRLPKVTMRVGVIKKQTGTFRRVVPNAYQSPSATAQYYSYVTKEMEVKEGTLLVYKGKHIRNEQEALLKLDKAIKRNKARLNFNASTFDMGIIKNSQDALVERRNILRPEPTLLQRERIAPPPTQLDLIGPPPGYFEEVAEPFTTLSPDYHAENYHGVPRFFGQNVRPPRYRP